MTAKEVIEALEKVPPNTVVLIPGYEDGFDILRVVTVPPVPVTLNSEKGWWTGKWMKAKRATKVYAVLMMRGER